VYENSRSVQHVHLEEEDVELTLSGYCFVQSRIYMYYLACLLSGGIVFLLARWMPQRYIKFVARSCDMGEAEAVVVEVSTKEQEKEEK